MDVALADWHAAGLRVASTVRLARLDCLEQSLLLHRLGALSAGDAQNLKNIWSVQVPVGTTESPCLSGVSFVSDGTFRLPHVLPSDKSLGYFLTSLPGLK